MFASLISTACGGLEAGRPVRVRTMGSTGEPDRKRRLSGSFAQGVDAVPPAKRPALPPSSDDKKLDFAVIKYRNQKLSEQLEVHKSEYHALEGKFDDLKQKQKSHHETQDLVNKSWQHLVRDLKAISVCKSGSQNSSCSAVPSNESTDGACIRKDKDFLSRLVETGATESSGCHLENHVHSSTTDALQNILFSSNDSWHANEKLPLDHFTALPEDGLFFTFP